MALDDCKRAYDTHLVLVGELSLPSLLVLESKYEVSILKQTTSSPMRHIRPALFEASHPSIHLDIS